MTLQFAELYPVYIEIDAADILRPRLAPKWTP
jgi:hypothetical protein